LKNEKKVDLTYGLNSRICRNTRFQTTQPYMIMIQCLGSALTKFS
jgi:hypothetical protein